MVSPGGDDLGPFESSIAVWRAGDRIPLGPGRSWLVTGVVVTGDDQPNRLIVEAQSQRPG